MRPPCCPVAQLIAGGLVAAALLFAPAADAATLTAGTTVAYTAATGERNDVRITTTATSVTVRESVNVFVNWSDNCSGSSTDGTYRYITCNVEAGVSHYDIDVGDEIGFGDTVVVSNGPTTAGADIELGEGHDFASGTDRQDTINGGGGGDSIVVTAGNDIVSGGADRDELRVGQAFEETGATIVLGGAGSATVAGDFEVLVGHTGPDTLVGDDDPEDIDGAGNIGGNTPDTLTGNGGNDRLHLSQGGGSVDGGAGDDQIRTQAWPATVDGGTEGLAGDSLTINAQPPSPPAGFTLELDKPGLVDVEHLVTSSNGNDVIKGDAQANVLEGADGNDRITGGAGVDQLRGQDGDDVLLSHDGEADTVDCGPGTADNAQPDPQDAVSNCETLGVVITAGPSGTTGTADATFEFMLPAAPAGRFECSVDGGSYLECTSPFSQTFTEGQHAFRVRFVPEGESAGSPSERTWTVDLTAPQVIVTSAPSGTGNPSEATIEFTSSKPDGAAFSCRLDVGPEYDCSSPQRLLALGDGAHQFTITTTDTVGHTSAPVTVSWSVGGAAPIGGDAGGGGGEVPGSGGAPGAVPGAAGGTCPVDPNYSQTVAFGAVIATVKAVDRPAACFKRETLGGKPVWVSTGRVFVNGLGFAPHAGTRVIVDPALTTGYVKMTGPSTLIIGSAELTVPEFTWDRLATDAVTLTTRSLNLLDKFLGPGKVKPGQPPFKYLGLPIVAMPTVELSPQNGGEAKLGIKVGLPTTAFTSLPGPPRKESDLYGVVEHEQSKGISFDIAATTSNDLGLRYTGKVKISELWFLGRYQVKDLELGVDSLGRYDGSATLVVGSNGAEFKVTVQLGPDGFLGPLRKLGFVVSRFNKPLTPFIFLQRFGGEASRGVSDVKVSATAGMSFGPDLAPLSKGPALALDGTLALTLPDAAVAPWYVEAKGDVKVIDHPIGNLSVKYTDGKGVTFGGFADMSIFGRRIAGQLDSTLSWASATGFTLTGTGDYNGTPAQFAFSPRGAAVCSGQPPNRSGWAWEYGEYPSYFGNSCDIGPYIVLATPAQASRRTLTVASDTRLQAIEVTGRSGLPAFTLSGPAGFAPFDSTRARPGVQVLHDEAGSRTHLVLERPPAGTYVIEGPDVANVRVARELPAASVRAAVRGTGRARALTWRSLAIPGQELEFVERGPAGDRVLLTTRRARGTHRFRPTPTRNRGRRVILVNVHQNGLPRAQLRVGGYSVTPLRLRKIARLRLRGSRLTWKRQAAAARYAFVFERRRGDRISLSAPKNSLTLPRALRRGRLSVRGVAVDGSTRPGPMTRRVLRR